MNKMEAFHLFHAMSHPLTSHSVLAQSTRFWDKASRKYAASPIADLAGYERTLVRVRQLLQRSDNVLELGCGTGSTALRLADAVARYVATDLSPSMVDIALAKQASAPPAVQHMLQFLAADADVLLPPPARDHLGSATPQRGEGQGWDAVLAFNLLHLVPDPDRTLSSVVRQLRPGGLFISKTACIGNMNALVPHVALPLMRLFRLAPPVQVLTEDALLTAIERSGLIIAGVEHHATPGRGRDWRPFVVARKPVA
jgi:SAM-dependent methyltransferase